jgi:hypothetical protein
MAKPEKVLRYFDAIIWNNPYGQSIKSTHFLSLDHLIPLLSMETGIMFLTTCPDSRLQKCKLKVTLLKYHTSFLKKAFISHFNDVGADALRPKTSD